MPRALPVFPVLAVFAAAGRVGAASAADVPVVDATRVISLSTAEVIGMGGAGIGFATGASGLFFQPGAPANRKFESTKPFAVSFNLNRIKIEPADLGNLGTDAQWSGSMTNLGVAGVFHNVGLGACVASVDSGVGASDVVVTEGHVSGGGALWDGHVMLGAGWRVLSLDARKGDERVVYTGSGFETGVALNQMWDGWNLGAVFRSPIDAERGDGSLDLLADGVAVPWEVGLGAGWQDVDGERRRPVRVAADLIIDGPVRNGVSMEAALDEELRTRGPDVSFAPHVGVELTALPNRLRWRVGGYIEPARALVGTPRPHGTSGFELRLFHVRLPGLLEGDLSWEVAVDGAPHYLNVAWLAIGFWQRGVVGVGWEKAP